MRAGWPTTLAVLVCAACAGPGDLGRPRPALVADALLAEAGLLAADARAEPASPLPFTDDEAELRDRAWRFLMPAGERRLFDRLLAEGARTRVLPVPEPLEGPSAYFAALTALPVRSPASLYAALAGDAEADARLVGPFAATASRVSAADRQRLAALAALPGIPPPEAGAAVARVGENGCLIAWVRRRAAERARAYRLALDRLFVGTPQGQAVAAERAVRMLLAHGRALDGFAPPGSPCAGGLPQAAPAPLVVKG